MHLTARRHTKHTFPNVALTSTGRRVARGLTENTASCSQVWHSDVNPNTSTGRLAAETTKNQLSHHNLEISRNNVGQMEKVHSNVQQKLGRQPGDNLLENDVNAMIWGISIPATMKAAVHKIIKRTYVPPRTQTSKRSNSVRYFTEADPFSK